MIMPREAAADAAQRLRKRQLGQKFCQPVDLELDLRDALEVDRERPLDVFKARFGFRKALLREPTLRLSSRECLCEYRPF
jgi:hypothetical protein